MNDPIADLLARLRNALAVRKSVCEMPFSTLRKAVLDVLCKEGYLLGYDVTENASGMKGLRVQLKYVAGKPVLSFSKRVSRLGRRVYAGSAKIPASFNGLGVTIVSTSKGVMCDRDARRMGVGGEVLCSVL